MSTASSFVSIGSFPFCVPAYTFGDYVGGLTLAQVMAFFWNLETATFSFAATAQLTVTPPGTVVNVSMTGDLVLSPLDTTGDLTAIDTFSNSGVTKDFWSSTVAYSAVSKAPRDRVCNIVPLWFIFGTGGLSSATAPYCEMLFDVCIDPGDSTKYAIMYNIFCNNNANAAGEFISLYFFPTASGSVNTLNTGTFTLAGITFPYACTCSRATSGSAVVTTTGGTLTCSSSNYSY